MEEVIINSNEYFLDKNQEKLPSLKINNLSSKFTTLIKKIFKWIKKYFTLFKLSKSLEINNVLDENNLEDESNNNIDLDKEKIMSNIFKPNVSHNKAKNNEADPSQETLVNAINQNNKKPKRSNSTLVPRKKFEKEDFIIESDDKMEIINLKDSQIKHELIFNERKGEIIKNGDKKARHRTVVRKPQIVLNLPTNTMELCLPIPSFPNIKDFERAEPINCDITIIDNHNNSKHHIVKIQEKNCKIGDYKEEPKFLDIGLFKRFSCEINSAMKSINKRYEYNHNDESIYLFLDSKEKHPFLFNRNQFFNPNDCFWILLENKMKLIPEPYGCLDCIKYPNYKLNNIGFLSESYEIQILNEIDEKVVFLFKKPEITLTQSTNGLVFDEKFKECPLFSKTFYLTLRGSESLFFFPKLVHIQNLKTNDGFEQEDFYEKFNWTDGNKFEINPNYFQNKIGYYQIDIEFFLDHSFKEKISDKSIRAFFRYCPIKINFNDKIILPSKKGHKYERICIEPINQQNLLVECNKIKLQSKVHQKENKIWKEFAGNIPKDKDQIELILSSNDSTNRIKAKPFIPRLKWRLTNVKNFINFIGKPLEFPLDQFSIGKKIDLEIRIMSGVKIEDLLLNYVDKEVAIRIKDESKFLYSFPISSIYEEIIKYVKRNGKISLILKLKRHEILIMNIFGEKEVFRDHIKPQSNKKLTGNHKGIIKNNIKRELIIRGYNNIKGRMVVSTIIIILSNESKLKKKVLLDKLENDKIFRKMFNYFLDINTVSIRPKMIYEDFMNRLSVKTFEKLMEIIEYLKYN